MKQIAIIVIIAAVILYGKFHGLLFLHDSNTDSALNGQLKCITKEGNVIYGDVPQGTVCERREPIKGSLKIVPSVSNDKVTNENSSSSAVTSNLKCDGRTRCSQMTSCAEATFFLDSCPNTAMDGDGDGIPCEDQWCR